MSAPTALYRRYRPDSFATVIGQEHVTSPLMTALDKNRVNHAYLFSGPRGCGKTTSARILARCLNCAQGPTSHPCGTCESCVELARGGTGSLDVIEIDAASHGGVDDARDLRERATFAPIRDRYKIFIIDEAHMVTSAGFNALLKIVEEPPEHIKFIFATTEPDKVIGTIRSRTHHYPFRLVPPEPLMAYLAQLCEQENVPVAPGVLSLVVRAGGGSVRDSLSVLDQLMAGAGASGLDYDLAVDLLGYTHASLLDDVVEALAASDSATVFKSVDRVIQTGHDPRRFVEDLLERFRDLIIVQAMPESAHAILRGTPEELIARMQSQAAQLGAAELSRAADVTNAAFNEMTGATSPRLHLELLGARLLLPGADSSTRGMATRLEQLERRLNYAGTAAAAPASAAPMAAAPERDAPSQRSTPAPTYADPSHSDPAASSGGLAAVRAQLARAKEAAGAEVAARQTPVQSPTPAPAETPAVEAPPAAAAPTVEQIPQPMVAQHQAPPAAVTEPVRSAQSAAAAQSWDSAPTPAAKVAAAAQQPQPAASSEPQSDAPPSGASGGGTSNIEIIRRAWPEILGALRNIRMASWVIVNQNVVPQTFDGQELRVGLPSAGLISTFTNSGHLENLQQAINQVLGMTIAIMPAAGDAPKASAEPNPKVQTGNQPAAPRSGRGTNTGATAPLCDAPAPAPSAPPQTLPAPAASAPAPLDAWGLPAAPVAAPQIPATAAPVPAQTAPTSQPQPAQAPLADSVPTTVASAPAQSAPTEEPAYWDGPSEPSDPWDEPHPDSYPPADPYPDQFTETAQSSASLPEHQAPSAQPAAAAPQAHTVPRVSPIAAWTTGWDAPAAAEEPATQAPAQVEAPKRSALLAAQMSQAAPQDWGVSLGAPARTDVADPGWGSMSNAPDWAQTESSAAPTDTPTDTPAETPAAAPADTATSAPADPAEPAIAVPIAPAPAAPPATAAPETPAQASVPAQEAPASNIDNGGAKMSRYQRLATSPEAQAARAQAPAVMAQTPYVEDVPSPDDVTIEESGVVGQAAVERILGGVLIEERPLNASH
ncbi:DNA polymerase III subunit gamma and tau [Arthrobacter glacialis]|uniref:DNA-directed DNA polymerase n=1 Tax=Arthrobacter glacialis TaxID=1664 RepID=A0A2S3ZYN3_ARTGL|nr:DNA polymerase III subunit gamma and tau [Arthrobacter glacialis]POH74351.1 DNA polymerase III subunit gamma and tau [Arthrobacter glacialis]